MRPFILCIPIIFFFESCRIIAGLHSIKQFNDHEIIKIALKYGIDSNEIYKINEREYLTFAKSKNDSSITKDLLQPLQVIYFSANNKIEFQLLNCDVGGFPVLQWNRYGTFDNFPPSWLSLSPPDSTLNSMKFFEFIVPINGSSEPSLGGNGALVVIWNHFFGRNSKQLIELIIAYRETIPEDIPLYFVNTDNLYALIIKEE